MCETDVMMLGDGDGDATAVVESVVAEVEQPTSWNYSQVIKAIADAEVQRDCVFNGIRRILTCGLTGEDVIEELHHVHGSALATGPGLVTQRLAVTLEWFLADHDYRKADLGINYVESDEIKEARALLELLT